MSGRGPSLHGLRAGPVALVLAAIAAGADIEERDEDGLTPLMFWAWTGTRAASEALLRAGARTDAVDKVGATAFVYAMETTCTLEMVRLLLAYGADVNRPKGEVLRRALLNCGPAIIAELLDAGADPNAPGIDGFRPLDFARHLTRDPEAEALLVQHGARSDGRHWRSAARLRRLCSRLRGGPHVQVR